MCRYQQDCLEPPVLPVTEVLFQSLPSGLWWGNLVPRAEGRFCAPSPLFFWLLSTPAATAQSGSPCWVGRYWGNLLSSSVWTADSISQLLVSCIIVWSSPGRGDGNGATHLFLSPAVVVHIPPIALGMKSPSLLHSQTGHVVPNSKISLNWE